MYQTELVEGCGELMWSGCPIREINRPGYRQLLEIEHIQAGIKAVRHIGFAAIGRDTHRQWLRANRNLFEQAPIHRIENQDAGGIAERIGHNHQPPIRSEPGAMWMRMRHPGLNTRYNLKRLGIEAHDVLLPHDRGPEGAIARAGNHMG